MNTNYSILVVDTETGGFDPSSDSLLSLGAVVWKAGEIRGALEILIAEPTIVASNEALAVNNLDIDQLRRVGISPRDAVKQLEAFVRAHFPGERVTLGGHNTWFDADFMRRLYKMGGGEFRSRFSHRYIDTASIVAFLSLCGYLPEDVNNSDRAFQHFGIEPAPGLRHTALGDATATAHLLTALTGLLRDFGRES